VGATFRFVSASLILDASFAAPLSKNGWVRLRLVNASPRSYSGFRLGVNSVVQLTPRDETPASLQHRIGSHHELVAPAGFVLEPGAVWDIGPLDLEYQLVHANDGPFRAFLVEHDGTIHNVQVAPVEKMPTVKVGGHAPPSLALERPSDIAGEAWSRAAGCERRLFPDDSPALGTNGEPVTASIDDRLGPEGFSIESENGMHTVAGGSPVALQWALIELAKRQRGDTALDGTTFAPRYGVRGFVLDLSRHFYPAVDVAEVIDAAAWRRLNVVHLHLTDDDAWRLPIAAYPELTDIGSWRGYGHAIPPLQGSGADLYGGSYTRDQIRGWIAQAAALGIELVPEIDTPGHCYAAVTALPHLLRDPDDTRTGESVHHFSANTLNPGLAGTREFLETVFGELADLFPSPAIHMGCDEVPDGVWDHSPAAQRYAAERGIEGSHAIARSFMAEIGDIVKATGRRVNVWQEAAEAGSVAPGDGWVGGWKSSADCRTLAASGFDVIAMPAEAYYLDMATGPDFDLPGHFWAGSIDDDTIRDFDPTAGWTDEERAHLVGVMACQWGEHIPDRSTLRRLVYHRLTTFADTAWRTA
jgi:hexosaminidase